MLVVVVVASTTLRGSEGLGGEGGPEFGFAARLEDVG